MMAGEEYGNYVRLTLKMCVPVQTFFSGAAVQDSGSQLLQWHFEFPGLAVEPSEKRL